MKHCDNCKIDVDTNQKYCPLCYQNLKETSTKEKPEKFSNFKIDDKKTKNYFALKLLIFINVLVVSILAFINIKTQTSPWSLIVGLACFYVWVLFEHTIISHDNAFRKVFVQIALIFVFLLTIILIYGNIDCLVDYIYPSLAMATFLFTFIYILSCKNKHKFVTSFFSIDFLLLIVSIIFVSAKVVEYITINQINILVQALGCFLYLLFYSKTILKELARKFHI